MMKLILGLEIDMERKLKRWSFWIPGIAPNVGASVIVVSAGNCLTLV